jgi:hypothetical protein
MFALFFYSFDRRKYFDVFRLFLLIVKILKIRVYFVSKYGSVRNAVSPNLFKRSQTVIPVAVKIRLSGKGILLGLRKAKA